MPKSLTIVGYTGTSKGMTSHQKELLLEELLVSMPNEFHHGDCVGGDAEAHHIVKKHFPRCKIIIHPPRDSKKRAFCQGHLILREKPFLARNKDIVDCSHVLIATPFEEEEILRSGTWSTYRYAKKQEKEIRLILPTLSE